MAAGDVDVRIVNLDATEIDTAVTAQKVLCGLSGAYMMAGIDKQVVCVAIQTS